MKLKTGSSQFDAEIARLRWLWQSGDGAAAIGTAAIDLSDLLGDAADTIDQFDRLQLLAVIAVCRKHHSLSDAGRELFNVSRTQRSVVNDADRLRKYLLKHDLDWAKVRAA